MPDPRAETLGSELRGVGARLAYPPTPSIAPAVGARLRADAARAHRPPFPRVATWPRRRLVAAIALATLLLATGAAAARRLTIGAVSIEVVPSLTPSAPPEAPAAFGRDLTLRRAVGLVGFEPDWPPGLGRPDDVYVLSPGTGLGRVLVLAWRNAEGLPPVPDTPWDAVLYEVPGSVEVATKYVGSTSIHPARVRGQRAFWISGVHDLTMLGAFGGEPVRISGNVLLWQRSPEMTYRLETMLSKAGAVALAETLRNG